MILLQLARNPKNEITNEKLKEQVRKRHRRTKINPAKRNPKREVECKKCKP